MLKLLGAVLILLVAVAGLGYYLGWFDVKPAGNGVDIRVNEQKIKDDEEAAKKKLKEVGGKPQQNQ